MFGPDTGCDVFEQRLLRFDGVSDERGDDESDEVIYVLSGSGAVSFGGEPTAVAVGSAAYVARGTAWRVERADDLVLLSVLVRDPLPPDGRTHVVLDGVDELQSATAGREFQLLATPAVGLCLPAGAARALPRERRTRRDARTRRLSPRRFAGRGVLPGWNAGAILMPRIERTAAITWDGNLARGQGTLSGASGAFSDLSYSLPTRIGQPEGKTSPEELLAAAHGGCLTMSLAGELTAAETPPGRIDATCRIVMDEVPGQGHQIVGSHVELVVTADGAGDAGLRDALAKADEGCPFSALLRRAGAEVRSSARLS